MVKSLYKYRDFTVTREGYHQVLSHIFVENFDYAIKELLKKYSDPDKKSETNGKILPNILDYSIMKKTIIDFMTWGFCIMSQMFNTEFDYVFGDLPLIFPSALDIDYEMVGESNDFSLANSIIKVLAPIVKKVDFEKDDDSLGHVQWLLSASNIRNVQYKIEEADLFGTRKIAGNIIPAMITTTALVSGYQIMEYIKIIKFYKSKSDINIYKNRFINLNTNYIDGITPAPVSVSQIGKLNFSLWDRLEVDTNSIEKIMEYVHKLTGKKVEYLMHGNEVIYDGDTIYKNYVDLSTVNLVSLIEDCASEVAIYMKQ
jgi:hypothetical protein